MRSTPKIAGIQSLNCHAITKNMQPETEIKYFKYENHFGNGPANTNNAIINADGDIIKIILDYKIEENLQYYIYAKLRLDFLTIVECCNELNIHYYTRDRLPLIQQIKNLLF